MAGSSSITIQERVRYVDCDPMGFVHHSVYPVWFETARTELLRSEGLAYSELEAAGTYLVVARLSLSFHQPARYDDVVEVTAQLDRTTGARIEHSYTIHRDQTLLCTGGTTLACVGNTGRPRPLPPALRTD